MKTATSLLLSALIVVAVPLLADRTEPNSDDLEARFAAPLRAIHEAQLQELRPLLTESEAEALAELTGHARKQAFIDALWRQLDPEKATPRNEARERWNRQARHLRGISLLPGTDPVWVRRLAGPPTLMANLSSLCAALRPIRIWFYDLGDGESMYTLFVEIGQGVAERSRNFELWWPERGVARLARVGSSWASLTPEALVRRVLQGDEACSIENHGAEHRFFDMAVLSAADWSRVYELSGFPRPDESGQRLQTILAAVEGVPVSAPLDVGMGELTWAAVGQYDGRTLVEGRVQLPLETAGIDDPRELAVVQLDLEGEIWHRSEVVESFRYAFHSARLNSDQRSTQLFFLRALEPGNYLLSLHGSRRGSVFLRRFVELQVPEIQASAATGAAPPAGDDDLARLVDAPSVAIFNQYTSVRIQPPGQTLLFGEVEIAIETTGGTVAAVELHLNGSLVARLDEAPFRSTIDLGRDPRRHALEAIALDAAGQPVARDEVELNTGWHHFAVRLVEPNSLRPAGSQVRALVEVDVPKLAALDRVELFLNDEPITTLYQAPFAHTMQVHPGHQMLRAVAHLQDGRTAEDLQLLQARGEIDEIDVQMVEMYVGVTEGRHLVEDLQRQDFVILEEGVAQQIERFEYIDNLPVNVVILMDSSGSMRSSMAAAIASTLGFIDAVLTERDRAAIVEFNHATDLIAPFTKNLDHLRLAAASMGAHGGTRLHDAVILSTHYFGGLEGKRALVVISDGLDQHSFFTASQMVEYGLRSGVAVYTISLQSGNANPTQRRVHQRQLRRLSEETGGRHFDVTLFSDLDKIYEQIRRELRSQYLLAYHAPEGAEGLRRVTVEVKGRDGLRVRTRQGYIAR